MPRNDGRGPPLGALSLPGSLSLASSRAKQVELGLSSIDLVGLGLLGAPARGRARLWLTPAAAAWVVASSAGGIGIARASRPPTLGVLSIGAAEPDRSAGLVFDRSDRLQRRCHRARCSSRWSGFCSARLVLLDHDPVRLCLGIRRPRARRRRRRSSRPMIEGLSCWRCSRRSCRGWRSFPAPGWRA